MNTHTIDTLLARKMVEAAAIRGASIIGSPGGWSVMIKYGMQEKPLGTQRTDKPRTWRSLDSCVEYLKKELRIVRIEYLDASNYSQGDVTRKPRRDASERMKRAHEAAAYDEWFREQVTQALAEADDPATQWVSNEDAKKHFATKREELRQRIKATA